MPQPTTKTHDFSSQLMQNINIHSAVTVSVNESRREILGWPTDTFEIDRLDGPDESSQYPHTVLLFIPGNPGCTGWYISMLKTVVEKLGPGYSARAASYAGHGVISHVVRGKNEDETDARDNRVAWTIDGQTEHKIAWIDQVTKDFITSLSKSAERCPPKFIFISHSIGSHLVQRVCVLRKDILLQTKALIHLMPFTRYDPIPKWKKTFLSTFANVPNISISILQTASKFAATLPDNFIDSYLERIEGMSLIEDRELARGLICNHEYAENFLKLGSEEIREVPELHDAAAMRLIGKFCSTYILYCGGPDQWAPKSFMKDIQAGVASGSLPENIHTDYQENLCHGFIVYPRMIGPAVDFIYKSIMSCNTTNESRRDGKVILNSKL